MLTVETKVKIPFLWGKTVFKKSNWAQINLIVGPNGSGKTLLAQKISEQFEAAGYSVKFLKADRNYSDQIQILKSNEKIRAKIEKVLSSMFGKSISFIEDIDGTLIPIVENKAWNVEYMLEDAECHGLREIISLLVNLYDTTGDDCLFIDEPELHLHPQFQTFFMNEIRKEVSHSSRRMFFLISHSPFYIDLRTPEELTGVIVCHVNKAPTSIEELNDEDDALFRRFLPRFNTYHKQFFFSDNQIFVEGYTDQQMFTYLLTFIENEYSAAGTGIIDVGGKDELGVFCKVCSLLGTNGRIITDLDSLFSGKLRDVANEDERVISWLEKQRERQEDFYSTIFSPKEMAQEITLSKLIFRLERYLIKIGQELDPLIEETDNEKSSKKCPEKMNLFLSKLHSLKDKHENAESVDTYKTVLLQGVNILGDELIEYLTPQTASTLPIVKNLVAFILAAAEAARIYILSKGCIEHYYSRTSIQYMPVSAKDRLFRTELEIIQDSHRKVVRKNYPELIELLEKAAGKN